MTHSLTTVATHAVADCDALGALLAMALLTPGSTLLVPSGLDGLARRVWKRWGADVSIPAWSSNPSTLTPDHFAGELRVVDTARASRLGDLAPLVARFSRVVAYDTHPAEPDDLPRAPLPSAGSCTAALVLALVDQGVSPSPTDAQVMLVGIHVDTGHFTFPATTSTDHAAAAQCIAWGARPAEIADVVPRGLTLAELTLLEAIAGTARERSVHGVSVVVLHYESDDSAPEVSGLLTTLREAERWPVVMLVTIARGRVSVIGRSDGSVDVGRICALLGGGGHPEAASAVLQVVGLADALRLVDETLEDFLGQSRCAADLMVRPFVAAPAELSVAELAEMLHQHRLNALPLYEVDAAGRRVWTGQVTRQEVDAALRHGLGASPAAIISARAPAWLAADAPLSSVRDRMLRGQGRIWLVGTPDDDQPGLLTRTTVLRAAAEPALGSLRRAPSTGAVRGLLVRALGQRWGNVAALGEEAEALGRTAWLVGGGVRDLLRERGVRDVDVVVEGDARTVAEALARRLGGAVLVHAAFGTAKWTPPGAVHPDQTIDIASARAEHYAGRAVLPTVVQADLRRDLYRRDFTINAMAVCLSPARLGEVLDPYGGWGDLQSGVLRVLHGLSFHDDPTRVIRAARFMSRFDLRLAPGTRGLLDGAVRSGVFADLGRERLGAELERLLDEPDPVLALRCLRSLGLLPVVHPAFSVDAGLLADLSSVMEVWAEHVGAGRQAQELPTARADWAWLVLAEGLPAEARAQVAAWIPGTQARRNRFVAGCERLRRIARGLATPRTPSRIAHTLRRLDAVEWGVTVGLGRRLPDRTEIDRQLWWWWEAGRHIRASVDGHWLRQQGFAPGPRFAEALARALDVAVDGGGRDQQEAAALAVMTAPAVGD